MRIAHPIVALPRQWEPTPPAPVEGNLPFDPSAFWLYPDWNSGPITEPFWMRPLKVPEAPVTIPPGGYVMNTYGALYFTGSAGDTISTYVQGQLR